MCDKICTQKIFEKARQIEIDDIIKNNKILLFGNKIKVEQKNQNFCKNCPFFDKKHKK